MSDVRGRLITLLTPLAPGLAEHLRRVRELHELPADVKGQCLDVIGSEAAERGLNHDGSVNDYGAQLDELADALELDES